MVLGMVLDLALCRSVTGLARDSARNLATESVQVLDTWLFPSLCLFPQKKLSTFFVDKLSIIVVVVVYVKRFSHKNRILAIFFRASYPHCNGRVRPAACNFSRVTGLSFRENFVD